MPSTGDITGTTGTASHTNHKVMVNVPPSVTDLRGTNEQVGLGTDTGGERDTAGKGDCTPTGIGVSGAGGKYTGNRCGCTMDKP